MVNGLNVSLLSAHQAPPMSDKKLQNQKLAPNVEKTLFQEALEKVAGKLRPSGGHPPADIGKDLPPALQKKLWEKSMEFEGVVLGQLVGAMLENVEESEFFDSPQGDLAKMFMAQQVGKDLAQKNGIGLADNVYRELIKVQEAGNGSESITRAA